MAYLAHPSPSLSSASVSPGSASRVHRQPMVPWPEELLSSFSLRMSGHGMSISRIEMQSDPRYALKQLRDAREMGDATLAVIADQLFRCFEAHQSGVPAHAH